MSAEGQVGVGEVLANYSAVVQGDPRELSMTYEKVAEDLISQRRSVQGEVV